MPGQLTPDPNIDITKSVPSYDTSAPGDPRSLPRKGNSHDIAVLRKIQTALLSSGPRNPFAVAHRLGTVFTHDADYRALYGLLTYLANDDLSDGDVDYLARTLNMAEREMLDQITL